MSSDKTPRQLLARLYSGGFEFTRETFNTLDAALSASEVAAPVAAHEAVLWNYAGEWFPGERENVFAETKDGELLFCTFDSSDRNGSYWQSCDGVHSYDVARWMNVEELRELISKVTATPSPSAQGAAQSVWPVAMTSNLAEQLAAISDRMYTTPQPAVNGAEPDIADIIAGALPTSRAHAYELMADALAAVNGAGLSEGRAMGLYMDFDRTADKSMSSAEYMVKFAQHVHSSAPDARWQLHHQHLRGDLEPDAAPTAPPAEAIAEAQRVGREIAADIAKCVEKGERMFDAPTAEADAKPIATLHRRNYAGTQTYALNPTRSEDGTMPWEALPVGDYPLYTRPAAPLSEVTDAMVEAGYAASFSVDVSRGEVGAIIRAAIAATSAGEGKV